MTPGFPGSRALPAVALLFSAACAASLTEPPSLQALAGGEPPVGVEQAEDLDRQARAAFGRRTPIDADSAADLWLRVAAADIDLEQRVDALVEAVGARVWLARHAATAAARRDAARSAVHAAQWCERLEPGRPACAYWLGAALGVQARERSSTGLDALPRIVDAFAQAAETEPGLERGGPDRALALLYLRAPGWPTGPGDPDLGLEHALRAVAIDDRHPPNWLALGEARRETGDGPAAGEAYRHALELVGAGATTNTADAAEWKAEALQALAALGENVPGERPPE